MITRKGMEAEREGVEGAEWEEVSSLLWSGAMQTAARQELESRGLASIPRQRPPAGRKPPLPLYSTTGSAGSSSYFGVPLTASQTQLLLDPVDGCGHGVWLPQVFVSCVRVLRNNVQTPGLFRKTGSVTRQRALRATLELGEELSSPNVHDVAGILKQYLRELPSPLILPSLHPTLEGVWSRGEGRERVELVMCALLQLPRQHLQVAQELCCLLSSVAREQKMSLMDSRSLAVVMTPNIMPMTHHSDPDLLETALNTNTGIVQLIIDHAHLIGLAPPHLINHAHQLAEEGVVKEEVISGSTESLDGKKQKRASVTDRVLGWGNKLMSTIGSVSRDMGRGSHDQSPGYTQDNDELQLGKISGQCLFDPSLPPLPRHTPKTQHHKRRRSFLGVHRHTDDRQGQRALFSNPFKGPSRSELSRRGAGRYSERRFPWLPNRTPSTPNPNVQLVSFGYKSTLTGEHGVINDGGNNRGSLSNDGHVLTNHAALTPVLGNSALLASVSEESVRVMSVGEGGGGEGGGEDGGGREGGRGEEGGGEGGRREEGGGGEEGEREGRLKVPKTYAVARKHSGKRMRCEVGDGEEGDGEVGRKVKRRHTIYLSRSRESDINSSGIRASKSVTTLQMNPDPSPGFTFSVPTPSHDKCLPVSVPTATDTAVSKVLFAFSNPTPARPRVAVTSDNEMTTRTLYCDDVRLRGSVCGASPIPHLPELPRHHAPLTPAPRRPPRTPHGQLNEGFLRTPLPPTNSPNLLDKINSELVDRYPLATPLATPTTKKAWPTSYGEASHSDGKPARLEFNASVSPDDDDGSKVMREVSFSFKLNSGGSRHSNNTDNSESRVPLAPTPRPPAAANMLPPKGPLQRKFILTPLLPKRPKFTDISTSTVPVRLAKPAAKTPRITKRAQLYVIPSPGNHGDKENMCGDARGWIV